MNLSKLHREAVSGDQTAERDLFEQLSVSFRMIAQHKVWNEQDAEEVVQEALKTVAEKFRQLTIESSFAAWAHRVLQNKIFDYMKTRAVQKEHIRVQANVALDGIAGPAHVDPMLRRKLLDCLRSIWKANRRYARILNLNYQGYSTEEICDRLNITSGNLYVTLGRARTLLAACLHKNEGIQ